MTLKGMPVSKILPGGCVAVLLVVAFLLRGAEETVYPVARQDLLQTVVTTGRVTSLARVEVSSQLLGSVSDVRVEAGDVVKAGAVLVRLKDDEARAALAQAQAAEQELAERLKQITRVDNPVSQQRVVEAEATARQARATFERVKQLHDAGVSSRADLDEAVRARDVAAGVAERERLLLGNSRPQGSDVKQVEARLGQAHAAVAAARERLGRTVITATGDGTVIQRKVEVGDVVQPGVPLLVLSRTGKTQLTAQIDEKNLGSLKSGQLAQGSADAYPDQTFPARVATVVPAVDPQRGTVEVRCDVAAPPAYLVPDMTVSVEIEVARHQKVLTLPAETVRDAATAPWLLVVRNGRAVRQDIQLGIRGSGSCEVKSGVKEGELVISAASKAAAGSKIRPRLFVKGDKRAH